MSVFYLIAGIVLASMVFYLLLPLWQNRKQGKGQGEKSQTNLVILREQLAELERERESGQLDAAGYARARLELDRRILEDSVQDGSRAGKVPQRRLLLSLLLALAVPAIVAGLYVGMGHHENLSGGASNTTGKDGGHALTQEQILGMIENLADKLQKNPADGQGWLMLARSYSVLGRYPESVMAYSRAVSLLPPDAQTFADYADTIGMVQGRRLQGEPEKLVRRAIEINPGNIKALALLGTIYYERQDYQAALGEWSKVLALVPSESSAAKSIQGSIRDAQNRLAASGTPVQNSKNGLGVAIKGVVVLDPSLAGRFAPEDTLFVFARAEQGPKMPLAILRKKVGDLPLRFSLDDSLSMSANLRISQYKAVVVGARISKHGDPLPKPGDWQGITDTVVPGEGDVKIIINSMIN